MEYHQYRGCSPTERHLLCSIFLYYRQCCFAYTTLVFIIKKLCQWSLEESRQFDSVICIHAYESRGRVAKFRQKNSSTVLMMVIGAIPLITHEGIHRHHCCCSRVCVRVCVWGGGWQVCVCVAGVHNAGIV